MARFMVRQRIERKIILDAESPAQADRIAAERYADNPDIKDPVARVVIDERFDLAIAIKPGAYPAEIRRL